MLKMNNLLFLSIFAFFITQIRSKTYDMNRILDKDFVTDVEYFFDPEANHQDEEVDSIKKYYHEFKETSINLETGAVLKCFIPTKLKTTIDSFRGDAQIPPEKQIKEIPENLVYLFMKVISQLCYNTSVKEWFYKLCPLKSASQTLNYKKKDEKGVEYTENFNIGTNLYNTQFDRIEFYKKDPDTLYHKYPQIKLDDRFTFLSLGGKIAKYFNSDFSEFKNTDKEIVLYYPIDFMKEVVELSSSNYTKEKEYITKFPNESLVPVYRKISKIVSDNLMILDRSLPGPIVQYDPPITYQDQKQKSIFHSFALILMGEYIYCFRCEFLTYYSIGDELFIKHGKYNHSKMQNKLKPYQGRVIIDILDNYLIRMSSPFDNEYNSSMRSGYITLSSRSKEHKYTWDCGFGNITFRRELVIGTNSSFKTQIKKGDVLLLLNSKDITDSMHLTSTNRKFYYSFECVVERVISDSLLVTSRPCFVNPSFIGTYFIGKNKDKSKATHYTLTTIPHHPFGDVTNVPFLNLLEKQRQEAINGKIDFYTFESLIIVKKDIQFYTGQYIFHPGLLIKSPRFSTFKFILTKAQNQSSKLRIVLSKNLDDYDNRVLSKDNCFELIFNSESGILFKSLTTVDNLEFYDTEIRALYQDKVTVELIFLDNFIYVNTSDDYNESSIKLKMTLKDSESIKFLTFDLYESNNAVIKNIKQINTVEQSSLINVFEYNKKLLLAENSYFRHEMINGDHCPGVGSRKTVVHYKCDRTGVNDVLFEKVEENKMCVYEYFIKTKWICNPYDIMSNKIKMGVSKTKCVIQNDMYHKTSKDIFEDNDKL